jgi:endonuclease/exonuclease/phosphatase family metal-dependent hydrolase
MPVLQLDRIYVRGFDVVEAKVLFGASWARLSDHAPITAELILQPTANSISPESFNEIVHASG